MTNNNKQTRRIFTIDTKLKLAIFRQPPAPAAQTQTTTPSVGVEAVQPKTTLTGYAMVWNTLSSDRGGGLRVRLLPGSAKFTERVHALYCHDYREILGTTDNGSLRLSSDNIGVKVEIDLPNTQTAIDVTNLIEDNYVSGMSFSMLFDSILQYEIKTEGGIEIQDVSAFTCDEVTVTGAPSFDSSSVEVQDDADDDNATTSAETAYARIEQSIKLEQLRLQSIAL